MTHREDDWPNPPDRTPVQIGPGVIMYSVPDDPCLHLGPCNGGGIPHFKVNAPMPAVRPSIGSKHRE